MKSLDLKWFNLIKVTYFFRLYIEVTSMIRKKIPNPIEREEYVVFFGTLHRDGCSSTPPSQSGIPSHGTPHTLAYVWISKISRKGDWKRKSVL